MRNWVSVVFCHWFVGKKYKPTLYFVHEPRIYQYYLGEIRDSLVILAFFSILKAPIKIEFGKPVDNFEIWPCLFFSEATFLSSEKRLRFVFEYAKLNGLKYLQRQETCKSTNKRAIHMFTLERHQLLIPGGLNSLGFRAIYLNKENYGKV